jgi:serine/threonine protein kinase
MSANVQPGDEYVKRQPRLREVDIVRVGGKFRLKQRIGSGSFGIVYLGVNIFSKEEVAIKLESTNAALHQLQHEFEIYKSLAGVGIPSVRWFGTECDYNALVLERLGPSLEDLFERCNRRFSLKTVLLLADQMISRIERIHCSHFIHRDIKPANFLMGTDLHDKQAYIIDFGLAKEYRDPRTYVHIPLGEGRNILTGTVIYASVNNHRGAEQARRDDLESLAYTLIYFLCGSLPWSHAKTSTKKQCNMIMQMKLNSLADFLGGWPNEFIVFLDYVRALSFEGKPDYAYLRRLFRDLCLREGHQYDYVFDWCSPPMTCLDDQSHQTPSSNAKTTGRTAIFRENDTDKADTSHSSRVYVYFFKYL